MQKLPSDIRKKIFTDLVVPIKLGNINSVENLKLAESIGNVPQAGDPRWKTIIERPGVIKVTEGALFGHKETLDWHCNKPSNPERSPIIKPAKIPINGLTGSFDLILKYWEKLNKN